MIYALVVIYYLVAIVVALIGWRAIHRQPGSMVDCDYCGRAMRRDDYSDGARVCLRCIDGRVDAMARQFDYDCHYHGRKHDRDKESR